jgi:hypothetical protein
MLWQTRLLQNTARGLLLLLTAETRAFMMHAAQWQGSPAAHHLS